MRGIAILVFIGFCGLVYCKPGDTYTSKYDFIDIDGLLNNKILLKKYVDCLLDVSTKCTKDAEELKKHISEALQDGCSKCTEAQRNGTRKVIHFLIKEKREWWEDLQKKYDPQNSYVVKYADELKKAGITL